MFWVIKICVLSKLQTESVNLDNCRQKLQSSGEYSACTPLDTPQTSAQYRNSSHILRKYELLAMSYEMSPQKDCVIGACYTWSVTLIGLAWSMVHKSKESRNVSH
jgi:hypothetical protein